MKKTKLKYIIQEEHALEQEARPLFHRLLHGGIIRETYLKDLAMHLHQFPEEPIGEIDMIKGVITDYIMHNSNIDQAAILDQTIFSDK